MKNVIITFTKDEINQALERCNFTQREKELFNLRRQEKTLEECAEIMNLSVKTVGRTNKGIINKLTRLKLLHDTKNLLS